ncbi:hypothetical protein V7056_19665 [Bacillus sp. JJ664]
MTRNRGLPQFLILDVSKDSNGKYAKIKAEYTDGDIVIRCGLDSLTYSKLKNAFSNHIFDKMPGLHYEYKLLDSYSTSRNEDGSKVFFGNIECILGNQTKHIEFNCTETFAGNMVWLNATNSYKELEYLIWKD